jgi:hypothetical protein
MLKLNVGSNRKVGLPDYGSAGASCNLEVELEAGLFHDLDGLHKVIKRAYAACNQAVQDELARLRAVTAKAGAQPEVVEVRTAPRIPGARVTAVEVTPPFVATEPPARPVRAATVSQIRAIRAIASRRRIDLAGLLQERFGVASAAELGIRQASELIDELKVDEDGGATTNGHANGNGTYATKGGAR